MCWLQVFVGLHMLPLSPGAGRQPQSHHLREVNAAHVNTSALRLAASTMADSCLIWESETLPLHWTAAGELPHTRQLVMYWLCCLHACQDYAGTHNFSCLG